MSEKKIVPIKSPTQNPRNSFPAWRLPKGTINATDGQLNCASSSCERWEWGFAAIVVAAVLAECIIAYIHPTYDSRLNRLGSLAADVAIAIGIAGEVIFGRLDARIQTEMRNRSNKLLAEANERTEKLRAATAWRTLSEEKHKALIKALRASGAASVRLTVVMGDQESMYFAKQISSAFESAGWKVGNTFETYLHEVMTGIALPPVSPGWTDEIKSVNRRVRDAFIGTGIDFATAWPIHRHMYVDTASIPPPWAFVYVGPRPPLRPSNKPKRLQSQKIGLKARPLIRKEGDNRPITPRDIC